jgi:hypothetical protein
MEIMENKKGKDPYFPSFTHGKSTITSSSSTLNLNQHARDLSYSLVHWKRE